MAGQVCWSGKPSNHDRAKAKIKCLNHKYTKQHKSMNAKGFSCLNIFENPVSSQSYLASSLLLNPPRLKTNYIISLAQTFFYLS